MHAWHSGNLRDHLSRGRGDVVVVLLDVILNLDEGCIRKKDCHIRVYLLYLVKEVLLHVLVAILDEHLAGDLSLYKTIGFNKLNIRGRRVGSKDIRS